MSLPQPRAGEARRRTSPPLLLRFAAFSIFFFPASMILEPLGAAGTVPLLLALTLFALWLASWLFGLHDPVVFRHPGRIGLALLILGTCASYVALYAGWVGESTIAGRASADRWLLLLFASAGLILVITETVRTIDDALVVVRALLAGGTFCCLVAVTQFYLHINPVEWIQQAMPGFVYNGGDTTFQVRGALIRVAGTTFTPIELGVVCSMLLPISIWRGLHDPKGKKIVHWAGTLLLVFAVATTISRSGVLGVVVGILTFLPFLPRAARQWALVLSPAAIVGLFLGVPGLVSTLTGALTADASDPSISTRTNNYPRVAEMVEAHPLVGTGPGTYLPTNALQILDNQYLTTLVSMGLVGLACLIAYLTIPAFATLAAARRAQSSELRTLAGAVAAGGMVAAACSATFDSLSFPVFALLYPVFVGLGGAIWIMVKKEYSSDLVTARPTVAGTSTRSGEHDGGTLWTR